MERPRILVVDDDKATRRALSTLFHRRGWLVDQAATVADGLILLASNPNCLILDLNLPDGGGETILREVRTRFPGVAVAVCSASVDSRQLEVVRSLRPELMLCKPIDFAPLDRLCEHAIAG